MRSACSWVAGGGAKGLAARGRGAPGLGPSVCPRTLSVFRYVPVRYPLRASAWVAELGAIPCAIGRFRLSSPEAACRSC